MLAFHLIFPTILLAVFWRGRMKSPLTLKADLPIFLVIVLFPCLRHPFHAGGWDTKKSCGLSCWSVPSIATLLG